MTDHDISPLRRRMIGDMTIRKLAVKTNTTTSPRSPAALLARADEVIVTLYQFGVLWKRNTRRPQKAVCRVPY